MAAILDLVDRASRDPELLRRLRQDPFGTARAEGVAASQDELRGLFGAGTTSAQAAELLQGRLSYSSKSDPKSPLDNYGYAGAGSMY